MVPTLELSVRGLGKTSPNPIVGAVIVAPSGEIIGSGFHADAIALLREVKSGCERTNSC